MIRTFVNHMLVVVILGGALGAAAIAVVFMIDAKSASAAALPPESAPSIRVEQDVVAAPEAPPIDMAPIEFDLEGFEPPAGPATTLVESRPLPETIEAEAAPAPDPVEDLQQAENRLASVLEQLNGLVHSSVTLNESLLKIKLADQTPAVETSDQTQ